MTRDELAKRLPIMQAWVEGKRVQWRPEDHHAWLDCLPGSEAYPMRFLNDEVEWRIAPEPKEWWLCPEHPNLSVRSFFQTCSVCDKRMVRVHEVLGEDQ